MAKITRTAEPGDRAVRDFTRALDPGSLFRDLGMEPDDWQQELLSDEIDRGLVNCCRQSGKSSTAAVLALHQALYHAPALVLLVSPSQRQSAELFRKVADFYHSLPGEVEGLAVESVLRMELSNGSRIISLPGSDATVRGYSAASLVIIDEASRVSDELVTAIRPTLAVSNGRLLMLSTPFGKRGTFYREWAQGDDHWKRFMLTAPQCPRIPKEFLDEERRSLGEFLYLQEYECVFIDPNSAAFSSELIDAALSDEVRPLWS